MKNYSAYFDNSFDGVIVFDNEGSVIYKNKNAESIYQDKEISHFNGIMSFLECKHSFDDLKKNSIVNQSYSLSNAGVRINYSFLEEKQICIVKTNYLSNAFDMNLAEKAADAFLVISPDLKIVYANKAACILSEFTKSEIINKLYVEIFEEEHILQIPPKVNDISFGGTLVIERKLKTKSGKIINVELHTRFFENKHYFTVVRNNDLRYKFMEELELKNIELNEMNHKLATSESNYRHLFNSFSIGVIDAKADGTIDNMNEKMRVILGSDSLDTSIKFNVLETLKDKHTDIYNDILLSLSQGVEIEKFYNYESICNKKSYLKVQLKPYKSGNESKIMILMQDYTKHEKKEQMLRIFSTGLANSSAGIIVTDLDGNMVYVNNRILDLTGYTENELIGESVEIFDYYYGNQELYNDLWNTIRNNQSWQGEFRNRKKNGSKYWSSTMISHIKNQLGEVTNYISIQEDITEKKNLEKELKLKNQQLTLLIENIPDMIILKNEKDMWINANFMTRQILGISDNTAYQGKTNTELLSICIRNHSILKEASKKDEEVWEERQAQKFEAVIKDEKGNDIIIKITKLPLFHSNGKRKGLITIGRNITRRRKYEQGLKLAKDKAEQADRLKSVFLDNMSHEIKTPLNAIEGFIDIIANYELGKEALSKYAEIIKVNSHKLISIIEDVIFYSKLQVNKVAVGTVRFNLGNLLFQVKQIFEKEIEISKKNDIKLSIQNNVIGQTIVLETDKEKLFEIFTRLISNAIKFTHKGEITFGFNITDENEIVCFVKDTGVGIEKEKQEIIFEQFRQIDDSSTRKYGGTGLGLTIVQNLLDLLNGKIWLESEAGKGSTFYFKIPFKSIEIMKCANEQEDLHNINWTQKTLLIVDDMYEYVEIIKESLKHTKINIKSVSNGLQAIETVKTNNDEIDAIIMDIQMPGIDGLQAAKTIKEINPDMPIIIHTAFKQSAYKHKSKAIGCDAVIYKPLNASELMSILRIVFS